MGRETVTTASKTSTPSSFVRRQPPARSTVHPIAKLQKSIGNQAIQRLINSHYIQAKLQVGPPGDQLEQEADRMADTVMRMRDDQVNPGATVSNRTQISRLQRKCTECEEKEQRQELEEEEEPVQTKPDGQRPMIQRLCTECSDMVQRRPAVAEEENEKEEEMVQRKAAEGGGNQVSQGVQSQIESFRGGGQPLPSTLRAYFEPRFGHDFGGVRIHAGGEAAKVARSINAQAFTVGRDVAFAAGQYSPETSGGKRLLAHELTHVVQQGEAGRTSNSPDGRGSSSEVQRTTGGHSDLIQRTIGDGHDLQSPRFSLDVVLEGCFDDERLLRRGARGPAVEKIQQALVDAGFPLPVFGVDGKFEAETQGAVRDYQRARGLSPDGIVGPITMARLDAEFAGPTLPVPVPPVPIPPVPIPPVPVPPVPVPPVPVPVPPVPVPPVPVPPVPVNITGGSELWHFNGESPTGYPLQQTLTASAGGAAGTFRWSIPAGSGFADFSGSPTAVGSSAVLRSKLGSSALNDVTVRVDFTAATGGGVGTASRQFTVRRPDRLSFIRNDDHTDPTFVYETTIFKKPLDQFGTDLPRNVEVNEEFTALPSADFPGMDWRRGPNAGGVIGPPNWLFDIIGGETPGHTPAPVVPTNADAGVKVYHWPGIWRIGSSVVGSGRNVAAVTWQKFRGRARHV